MLEVNGKLQAIYLFASPKYNTYMHTHKIIFEWIHKKPYRNIYPMENITGRKLLLFQCQPQVNPIVLLESVIIGYKHTLYSLKFVRVKNSKVEWFSKFTRVSEGTHAWRTKKFKDKVLRLDKNPCTLENFKLHGMKGCFFQWWKSPA